MYELVPTAGTGGTGAGGSASGAGGRAGSSSSSAAPGGGPTKGAGAGGGSVTALDCATWAGSLAPDAGSTCDGAGGSDGGAWSTCTPPVIDRLVQKRNVASPLPEARGITYDGQKLWLLASTGSPTLARVDPDTLAIEKSFTPSLPLGAGTGAYGIAWDGHSIWVSIAGDSNALVTIDPDTGTVTRTMSSPTMLGPSDLDFDGQDLWLSSGTGDVYRIDPTTGGILQHFTTSNLSAGRDDGVVAACGAVVVSGLFGDIGVYDAKSGELVGTAVHQNGSTFSQMETGPTCLVGDQIVMLSMDGITYFDVAKAP